MRHVIRKPSLCYTKYVPKYESANYGILATIDPHIPKAHTKLYKIPKFTNISEIQPFQNVKIYKEVYGHLDAASE